MAADYELKSLSVPKFYRTEYHLQALTQYMHSVNDLQQTRLSQGSQLVPGTYVPLAKSYLDAARMLYLLDRKEEADSEVKYAEGLLRDLLFNQDPGHPLPRAWLWRVYYLLGDSSLYENNVNIALFDYRQAQSLNPGFVPASAMIAYLSGTVDTVELTAGVSNNMNTSAGVAPRAFLNSQQAETQPATALSPSSSNILPQGQNTPNRMAHHPQTSNTGNLTTVTAPQEQDVRELVYREMQQISASKLLSTVGSIAASVATLLEITELAPIAAAITLSGIIVDAAVSK